jgi:hypothetical protein
VIEVFFKSSKISFKTKKTAMHPIVHHDDRDDHSGLEIVSRAKNISELKNFKAINGLTQSSIIQLKYFCLSSKMKEVHLIIRIRKRAMVD